MVWSRLGARRAYTLGAGVFGVGTVCCALAPEGSAGRSVTSICIRAALPRSMFMSRAMTTPTWLTAGSIRLEQLEFITESHPLIGDLGIWPKVGVLVFRCPFCQWI